MVTLRFLVVFFCLTGIPLIAAPQDNILLYTDSVQVTSEVSPYETLQANQPIKGTLMITHVNNLKVDPASVKMGGETLKVKFVRDVSLSSTDNLSISIYQFEVKGKPKGNYTLPPISVKVGDKEYQAPSLDISID